MHAYFDFFLHCLAHGHCYVKVILNSCLPTKTMWYFNKKFKFKALHCGVKVSEKELQMLLTYHCFAQFH